MPGTEQTPTEAGAPSDRIPDEVVADLLAEDRCRHVLAALYAADGPVTVCDLARAVLAREHGVDPDAVDEAEAAAVRENLFQEHLPRLTPTGLVEYDSLLGSVSVGTDDERVRAAVE
jgi:hypothetical protein